jgi:hypothetical protein
LSCAVLLASPLEGFAQGGLAFPTFGLSQLGRGLEENFLVGILLASYRFDGGGGPGRNGIRPVEGVGVGIGLRVRVGLGVRLGVGIDCFAGWQYMACGGIFELDKGQFLYSKIAANRIKLETHWKMCSRS